MTHQMIISFLKSGHRFTFIMTLCLFGLCMVQSLPAQRHQKKESEEIQSRRTLACGRIEL